MLEQRLENCLKRPGSRGIVGVVEQDSCAYAGDKL